VIQVDPIFLIFGEIRGEKTDRKVRLEIQARTAALGIGTGAAAVTALLLGTATPNQVLNLGGSTGVTISADNNTLNLSGGGVDLSNSVNVAALTRGLAAAAGGGDALNLESSTGVILGLPDPCGVVGHGGH
jgi:hypothetical protein